MRYERQARLENGRNDLRCARGLQHIELRVVFRADQHGHLRAQLTHGAHDAQRRVGVRKRDHDDARLVESEGAQYLGMRRVAKDHRVARQPRIADAERVEVERDVLEAAPLHHARQVLARRGRSRR